jgi:hypothetical protein
MFRRRHSSYGCRSIRAIALAHLSGIAKPGLSVPDGIVHFRTLAPLLPVEKNNGIWTWIQHRHRGERLVS